MADLGMVVPISQATYTNRTAIIKCFSRDQAMWTKDDRLLKPQGNVMVTLNSITFVNLESGDSGLYRCHGTNANGEEFEAKSELNVGGKIYPTVFYFFLSAVCMC